MEVACLGVLLGAVLTAAAMTMVAIYTILLKPPSPALVVVDTAGNTMHMLGACQEIEWPPPPKRVSV